ncbi:MAG: hypothetical protein Q7T16_04550 [Candidatus Burarchaeum sp.]|nr:hypothetical protein [Candidatus Burarchaeum sp.]MDO8339898.1 hypothetical protein [Candidatus Burarchaeum sp.]
MKTPQELIEASERALQKLEQAKLGDDRQLIPAIEECIASTEKSLESMRAAREKGQTDLDEAIKIGETVFANMMLVLDELKKRHYEVR